VKRDETENFFGSGLGLDFGRGSNYEFAFARMSSLCDDKNMILQIVIEL
jgi:hypothetical protein